MYKVRVPVVKGLAHKLSGWEVSDKDESLSYWVEDNEGFAGDISGKSNRNNG